MRVVILLLLLVAVANAALLRSKADPVETDPATPTDISVHILELVPEVPVCDIISSRDLARNALKIKNETTHGLV